MERGGAGWSGNYLDREQQPRARPRWNQELKCVCAARGGRARARGWWGGRIRSLQRPRKPMAWLGSFSKTS